MGVRDNPRLLLLSARGDDEMTITAIQQGDQYYLPVRIKKGDTYITNENCDDARVKLGSFLATFSDGTLAYGMIDNPEYDSVTNNTVPEQIWAWLFPITQERSLALNGGEVKMQVAYKNGETIRPSKEKCVWVDTSIITEEW